MRGRTAALAGVIMVAAIAVRAESWKNLTAESAKGLPGNEIQFLSAGAKGNVWVGTLSGAARSNGTTFEPVLGEEGEPLAVKAWCVLETGDGFWLGYEGGVLRSAGGKVQEKALDGYTVAPIVTARPGELWAIGKNRRSEENGLFEHAGEEWKPVAGAEALRVVDLFKSAGKLWLSLDGDGVLEVDPAEGIEKARHHLRGLNVTTVAADSHDRVWCGLWGRGVAVWDGTNWERHLARQKESAILKICQDAKGNIWVATSGNGAWTKPFNKQEWTQHLGDEGAINLLATSSDGRVWVSSQMTGGLRCWDGEKWEVSLDSPLPIRCFLEPRKGSYWAGGILDGLHISK